jgi:hypothetical protein
MNSSYLSVMRVVSCLLFLLATSCGYHYRDKEEKLALTVPFVKGDIDGKLTDAVIQALSSSGSFTYQGEGGGLLLNIILLSDTDERVGYRYDRNPTTGKRRKNIIGTENRETVNVEVTLTHAATQEVLFGPRLISASAEYDYVDSNSIKDLTFIQPDGKATTVIEFSLGQLDSIEGAHDDARTPIFRKLAQKLVDELREQL